MSQWVFEFSWLYCGYKGYIPVVCIPISVHIVLFAGDQDVLRTFVSAIFYIGKGKRARPYCHLYEAIKQQQNPADKVKFKTWHFNIYIHVEYNNIHIDL